jgi:hypothetical protein
VRIARLLLYLGVSLGVGTGVPAEMSLRDAWEASGQLAVEGDTWAAVFSREAGALQVYHLSEGRRTPVMKIVPLGAAAASSLRLTSCRRATPSDGEEGAAILAAFVAGTTPIEGTFHFAPDGAIRVQPGPKMAGLRVLGQVAYGIVPGAPLEDLIYSPVGSAPVKASGKAGSPPPGKRLHLPSDHLFVALLAGGNALFFAAWPPGQQQVALIWDAAPHDPAARHAFEIHLDGRPVWLKSVSAPGLWHEQDLSWADPDQDLPTGWKRPFPARWKTQLLEGEIETSYPIADEAWRTWRPNFGFYPYPVWFQGEEAVFHLSKKVSCNGRALIYALEGHRSTPLEEARQWVPDVPAVQKRRGLQRYPEDSVGLQNCDGRAWMQWMFRAGLQAREQKLLREALQDFLYSIKGDKARLERYPPFIRGLRDKVERWRQAEAGHAAVVAFLDQVQESLAPLETEFQEMMRHKTPAEQLQQEIEAIQRLHELIAEGSPEVYAEACYRLETLQLWSLIEAIPGRIGGRMRALFLNAGYGCAENPGAVKYAEEIRRDIREFLIHDETHETIY